MRVELTVLHTVGTTDTGMGGSSNCAALYADVANPAPVEMFTVPSATVVTHSNWECAYHNKQ